PESPPPTRFAPHACQIPPEREKSVNESGSDGGIPPRSRFPVRFASQELRPDVDPSRSQVTIRLTSALPTRESDRHLTPTRQRRRHVEDFAWNARGGRHLHVHDRTRGRAERGGGWRPAGGQLRQ